jgi:hypothetical protein
MQTSQQLIWKAMGSPKPKWSCESVNGRCATCGQTITEGVSRKIIESVTYSQQADYMKYGDYNCLACAWLNSDPKNNHRGVIVVGDQIWWPMISLESSTPDRHQWLDVICDIGKYADETPVTGCITTDPKPRLWPRYKLSTIGSFGLYIHAPDYDQSGFLQIDRGKLIRISMLIKSALEMKYSKRSVYLSLLNDFKITEKHPVESMNLERRLKELRKTNEFIPALLITQIKKEDKIERGNQGTIKNVIGCGTTGSGNDQNVYRLF